MLVAASHSGPLQRLRGAEDAWSETFLAALRAWPDLAEDTNVEDRTETHGIRSVGPAAETAAMLPVDEADMAALRARLVTTAEQRGLLDVAYRTLETPVGPLLLAATETGLVWVAFEREGFEAALQMLAAKLGPRVLEAPRRLDAVSAQLEEYFTGRRHAFDVPLDRACATNPLPVVVPCHRVLRGDGGLGG